MGRLVYILLMIFLAVVFVSAQSVQTDSLLQQDELVAQLKQAYNHFDYQKCATLLNLAFPSIDTFSPQNRIEIYKYAAFLAFRQGNSTLAENHFWQILEIDPSYTLDPVQTPPKLLTLFQKTKIEFLQELNRQLRELQQEPVHRSTAWRGLVFPGWEQWHRGYRTRGAILGGAALASLVGLGYAIVQTQQKKQDYQDASDSESADRLYDEYNRFYRQQFYFSYAFVATWILSQIDLTLWSTPQIQVRVGAVTAFSVGTPTVVSIHLAF